MCWNEHVSLNTFLFSSFVLGLVLYNNLYTPYKIKEVHVLAAYLFLVSVLLMQLVEYFLWRNLHNDYNLWISGFGLGLLLLQPVFGLSLIREVELREWLTVLYVVWVLLLGRLTVEKTVIHENGHLVGGFFQDNGWFTYGWLFFLFAGPIYAGIWIEVSIAVLLGLFTMVWYRGLKTHGSFWCWFLNVLFVYYLSLLLFWLPFTS